LCARRCLMRRIMARVGHGRECPVRPWPMTSPRTAFFWIVNVSEAKVTWSRMWAGAVSGSMLVVPTHMRTSWRVKGCASSLFSVYSPGRSRKKNAIQIRSAAANEESSAAAWAMAQASWRTPSGIGWRREGGGSALRKLWKRRDRRGSTRAVPGMTRGSGSPAIVCADATKETAAATVEAPTALWEAESRPSRTRTAKTESQKTALLSWAR
jgi:hypothetical protein